MTSRFMPENRRKIGNFEVIDFADTEQIEALRGQLEVHSPTRVRWNDWEYGSTVSELRALYEKGKRHQWNATTDLPWDTPVTNDEWIAGIEVSTLANVLKLMGRSEADQKAAAFDEVAFTCSQLLHGEQAALQLCGQLTNLCPTTDEKLYAANQVSDEARHVEIFARFVSEKMGTLYPISPTIKVLLDMLLSVETYEMKTLGMQTLFEGVAVGVMDMLRRQSANPLLSELIHRAQQDESRHAAFGVLTMRRVLADADEKRRNEMEDWALAVLEAFNANQQLDMLRVLGPKYGIEPEIIAESMLALPEWPQLNSEVYMHTVLPNLISLGLVTQRTESRWRELGMLVGKHGAIAG